MLQLLRAREKSNEVKNKTVVVHKRSDGNHSQVFKLKPSTYYHKTTHWEKKTSLTEGERQELVSHETDFC